MYLMYSRIGKMSTYNEVKDHFNKKQKYEKDDEIRAMRQYAFTTFFTDRAKDRLSNIKMIKPELYDYILDVSIKMANDHQLDSRINNEELKGLLGEINKPKDIKIRKM